MPSLDNFHFLILLVVCDPCGSLQKSFNSCFFVVHKLIDVESHVDIVPKYQFHGDCCRSFLPPFELRNKGGCAKLVQNFGACREACQGVTRF